MQEKNNISVELRQIAPALETVSREMPNYLPDGYFEMLSADLLAKVAKPQLTSPAVPEGYFENFPAFMLAKVKAAQPEHELAEVAPTLLGISREMPYSVPAGYFENFSVTPTAQETIDADTEAPVVPIRQKRRPLRWAVAAAVVVLLGMFTWDYFWYGSPTPGQSSLAAHPADSTAIVELAAALEDISDTTLNSEITDRAVAEELSAALYYFNVENIETALKDLSVEEIRSQLILDSDPSKKS